LLLIGLTGSLLTLMAANLLTLALGSALLDLGLVAMSVPESGAKGRGDRLPAAVCTSGVLATLVLFLASLQMSTETGSTSLLARNLPESVLVMLGIAGILRLAVFPLHPRRLKNPENLISLLLSVGTGIYILARTQAIEPVLGDQRWTLVIGGAALLAGGLLTWAGGIKRAALPSQEQNDGLEVESGGGGAKQASLNQFTPGQATAPNRKPRASAQSSYRTFWSGMVTHQAGAALVFATLLDASVPWPMMGVVLALGLMAVWWDGNLLRGATAWPAWFEWSLQRVAPRWAAVRSYVVQHVPSLGRFRQSRVVEYGTVLLPMIAIASLVGAPLTIGAKGRWPLYASLLDGGRATLMVVILAADSVLAAGLLAGLETMWIQVKEHRLKPAAILSMITLAIAVVAVGTAAGRLAGSLNLTRSEIPDVSRWGLGLIYVLPWLLGAWLARAGSQIRRYLERAAEIANLDWFYRAAGWAGQRLLAVLYWLGRVGEGDGWWGWALIIVVLAAIWLNARG
jgi:hypothetical protein